MSRSLLLLTLLPLGGCDLAKGVLEAVGLKVPTGDLSRVDLVKNPTGNQLLAWGCHELFGAGTCSFAGLADKPPKAAMLFSFDLVFDLFNPNAKVPIPLVDLLLGLSVFDGTNLGAACLSFCDPDEENCVATQAAAETCTAGANSSGEIPDLIPTIEELFGLAEAVIAGEIDNDDWRFIPGKAASEAHIQFDLDIDVFLDLADVLIGDAVDDFLGGRRIELDIPYTADGSMFFEAPELGREALGFGPFNDIWKIVP